MMSSPTIQDREKRRTTPLATPTTVLAVMLAIALGGCSGASSPVTSSATSPGPSGASSPSDSSSGFDGAALPVMGGAHDFTLADLTGGRRAVSLSHYRGRVVILSFLYSTCGATCVVIAQQIRGALDELGGNPIPVLLVSANPVADTPARVSSFLSQVSLTGRVHYMTGSLARLQPIWRAYGIVPASTGRSAFESSASVFLLDRSGRERVLFQSEQLTPEGIAHDVRKLW